MQIFLSKYLKHDLKNGLKKEMSGFVEISQKILQAGILDS